MLPFIAKRLLLMVPTLIIISLVGFIIIQAPPGDFVSSYVAALEKQGDVVDPELITGLRSRFGLDQPLHIQYWRWVSNFVQGNLGYSMSLRQPVADIILERLPFSVTISLLSQNKV